MNFVHKKTRILNFVNDLVDRYTAGVFQGPIPHITNERASYEALLTLLLERTQKACYDPAEGFFRKASVRHVGAPGVEAGLYEWIARTFIGAGFLMPHQPRPDLAKIYLSLISKGVDPASHHSWDRISASQILVENASLVIALLLNFDSLWPALSADDRKNMIGYIKKCINRPFRDNNWLWFKVFHYVFLEKVSAENYEKEITELLARLGSFYKGDGWYNDGSFEHETRFDYYNAWGMHYYGLLFCMLADQRYDVEKTELKERFKTYYRDSLMFLNENGLPVAYGRSLIYRFGMLSPLGLGIKLGLIDEAEYPRIHRLTSATFDHFFDSGILNAKGLLTLGYTQANSSIVQWYSSSGSPYWAFKAFSFLLLPADHVFWKAGKTADPLKNAKRTCSMKVAGFYIENFPDGHTLLLNGGMNSRTYPLEYNKFAYSNVFLPSLDHDLPDNSFSFLNGGKVLMKDTVHEVKALSPGVFQIEWGVKDLPELKAVSKLEAMERGYRLSTRFHTTKELKYHFCGFVVRDNSDHVSKLYAGYSPDEKLCGTRPVKTRHALDRKKSNMPYYLGMLKPGEQEVVFRVEVYKSHE